MKKIKMAGLLVAALLLIAGWDFHAKASATISGVNDLLSASSTGTQGNGLSDTADVSGDGRYVAFSSSASNLTSGDTNGMIDVFVKDRSTGALTLVSVSSSGVQGDGPSGHARISYDGRYVVFNSGAANLIDGTTISSWQIYEHDMQTGSTVLVSASPSGDVANNSSELPDVSADGRFVVFDSGASNLVSGINHGASQVFIKDVQTGATKLLSKSPSGTIGNNYSTWAQISCDGNVVAFVSRATNLVTGDTNAADDIFVDNLGWESDNLVDITLGGNASSDSPSISCNGNEVAYLTTATNLVAGGSTGKQVIEYNRLTSQNSIASIDDSGTHTGATSGTGVSLSDDGRFVAFDTMAQLDSSKSYEGTSQNVTYVRDTRFGTTQAVDVDVNGDFSLSTRSPRISADGSYAVFTSLVDNPTRPWLSLVSNDTNQQWDVFGTETGF